MESYQYSSLSEEGRKSEKTRKKSDLELTRGTRGDRASGSFI